MRAATISDAADITSLVASFAVLGQLLPRTIEEIEEQIPDFVVVVDPNDRIMGCAALEEYSPSLGEVAAVAVARDAQGLGLGTLAVRGVEEMARQRGIPELFAMTLADRFFLGLGYAEASLISYPEKLARYDALRDRGIAVATKTCLRKVLSNG